MTPNIIHFIYAVTEKTRPFSYLNSLAVRMAAKVQTPDRILFWTNAPPDAIDHWDDIKDIVQIMPTGVPSAFRGAPIDHPQYAADVLRLQILIAHGGIYMDTDMLLLKPLYEHMSDRLVLSWENPNRTSISNALMLSPPNNRFLREWLDLMPHALSSSVWANGGVLAPALLTERVDLQETRTVLPHTFCCPLDLSKQWLMDPSLMDEAQILSENSTGIHVWETYWRDYVKHLTRDYVRNGLCLFSNIARKHEGEK